MPLFTKDCSCLRKPEEEVHVLDYSHSNLDYLPSEVFHYERTLEELYVNANGIRELPRVSTLRNFCFTTSVSMLTFHGITLGCYSKKTGITPLAVLV